MASDDEGIGPSRAGQTSKIHMLVDACGNPVHFEVSVGNIADGGNAFARLKHFRAIATRHDKLKRNFHSTAGLGLHRYLAAIMNCQ